MKGVGWAARPAAGNRQLGIERRATREPSCSRGGRGPSESASSVPARGMSGQSGRMCKRYKQAENETRTAGREHKEDVSIARQTRYSSVNGTRRCAVLWYSFTSEVLATSLFNQMTRYCWRFLSGCATPDQEIVEMLKIIIFQREIQTFVPVDKVFAAIVFLARMRCFHNTEKCSCNDSVVFSNGMGVSDTA